jgi:hypothetical protein
MFPSIDNQTGIERVRCKLSQYAEAFDVPIECVIEALEICLKKNCSICIEGNIGCRKMVLLWDLRINSCSNADIVAEEIDKKVLESRSIYLELRCWFRFRDDSIVLWRGTMERLQAFFQDLNTFDPHPQFTMDVGGRSLHFLDFHS